MKINMKKCDVIEECEIPKGSQLVILQDKAYFADGYFFETAHNERLPLEV
jgi:hypothetical protein